ncbi:tumor necrosis factor receptor superfamily member 19 isoform X2 [Betta splendens]|uniref:Tumor necrosis factor receptor superfamily member 19 isoform X2 n=1 Tax=Betta splendens TaxID=158456 RepID=A0A9W2Y7J0_BETSP|nr:tumor necrosis factor receptor superfamily member 19 isoform X2 [Betta splendens]
MVWMLHYTFSFLVALHFICSCLIPAGAEEPSRQCREQEYKDRSGNCKPCKQCDAGQELSKECGFGYGEDARCVPCRSSRFKEDRSLQKCKPCLDCGLINRFQKGNCSTTSNAVCGDCLPGYYRKTKLSGFQDMECIPCGDPPPPYEPHFVSVPYPLDDCSRLIPRSAGGGRVDLEPLPSVVTSTRDVVLAAVICSALATVVLALLVLCVIYCKRQLLEKKPSISLRSQDCPYSGAELSCLDPRWLQDFPQNPCCQCHLGPGHFSGLGPVHLIPSLCCDESYSLGPSQGNSPFHSQMSLSDGNTNLDEEGARMQLGGRSTSACEEGGGMMTSSAAADCFRAPQCSSAPAAGREVKAGDDQEDEAQAERCKSDESCAETGTDALLLKQHSAS